MRPAAALFCWCLFAGSAEAEQLTIALSTGEINVDSTFSGDTVTLFGVIERDAATVSRNTDYEIAVVLRGPPETVVARRKDRIAFIWVNSASETIGDAPAFYALDTSSELGEIATPALLERHQIGFDAIQFTYDGRAAANDPAAAEFRDAFIRLKQNAGLYSEQPAGVSFIGATDNVFQSAMWIPANAPDGHYKVDVYLFSGNALLAHEEGKLDITKVGFEQFMYAAAHQHVLLYGLACVLLALSTGWLAGVIFRRD
ncbi:MAG: TIGR02186 family protein [Bauldia sp.]|uniref:TIGR02186 family protein n=1 Tax=Bauldia sp. TaxID=2575872 RepID=UPI001DA24528|nr:TIGR02186 family protein [Bauldia sp.]MCB1494692.1 TIGR02186 family protein [Bauldia sp.]